MLEHLEVAAALEDPAPEVRRRACELAGRLQFVELAPQLTDALGDSSAVVVEAACYALGELEGLCAEGRGRVQEAPVQRACVRKAQRAGYRRPRFRGPVCGRPRGPGYRRPRFRGPVFGGPRSRGRVSGARMTDLLQAVSPLLTLQTRLTRR